MANAGIDPSRLYSALLNTGLQNKDPALYQVIYNLIGQLVKLTADATASSSSSSSSSTVIQQTIVQLMESSSDGFSSNEPMMPPGGSGSGSSATIDMSVIMARVILDN